MAKPKILKPYVKSALKRDKFWRTLTDLQDLKSAVEAANLARKPCKGVKRRLKCAAKDSEAVPGPSEDNGEGSKEEHFFIGLRSALRKLNNNELGAILMDSAIIAPSAVAHVFELASFNRNCDFYKVDGLSTALAPLLNMPKVSAIGVGKDEPLTIQLKLATEVKETQQETKPVFQKPQFKVPVGKNKTKKGKKNKIK